LPPPATPRKEQAAFFYLGPSKQVAENAVFLSSFANVIAFTGDSGVLLVDTSTERFTPNVLTDLRDNYSKAPIEGVVYTHGHIDHVTGADKIIEHSLERGDKRPTSSGTS
jgi:glyoxylase-like metal-dependent hydrolase (beta-lactamase superfamily II)